MTDFTTQTIVFFSPRANHKSHRGFGRVCISKYVGNPGYMHKTNILVCD